MYFTDQNAWLEGRVNLAPKHIILYISLHIDSFELLFLTSFYCFEFSKMVHKIKSIWIHEPSGRIRNKRMGGGPEAYSFWIHVESEKISTRIQEECRILYELLTKILCVMGALSYFINKQKLPCIFSFIKNVIWAGSIESKECLCWM